MLQPRRTYAPTRKEVILRSFTILTSTFAWLCACILLSKRRRAFALRVGRLEDPTPTPWDRCNAGRLIVSYRGDGRPAMRSLVSQILPVGIIDSSSTGGTVAAAAAAASASVMGPGQQHEQQPKQQEQRHHPTHQHEMPKDHIANAAHVQADATLMQYRLHQQQVLAAAGHESPGLSQQTAPPASRPPVALSYTEMMELRRQRLGLAPADAAPSSHHKQPAAADRTISATYEAAVGAGIVRVSDPHAVTDVCSDTCTLSKNGVCNDGRNWALHKQQGYDAMGCDLGTDCSDCGPWRLHGTSNGTSPLYQLQRAYSVQDVRVKLTETQPQMLFPFTDPAHDVDVSRQVQHEGGVELRETHVVHKLLSGQCVRPDGRRRVVLDVGANFGWYSVYAAVLGCRVIAWEPVPAFRSFLQLGLQLNNVSHLVEVRSTIASSAPPGTKHRMSVPNRGVWGTASVNGINIDPSISNDGELLQLEVMSERIDDVLSADDDIALLKVDVEGVEPQVLRSARQLLAAGRIPDILLEYSPGIAERRKDWPAALNFPHMLLALKELQYSLVHLNETHRGPQPMDWAGELPALREVTAANLRLDLLDMVDMAAGGLGCPVPEQLRGQHSWAQCSSIPEDLHPKSFHSAFGFNTNVWASRASKHMRKAAPVGALSWSQDLAEYFVPEGQAWGMAHRLCADVGPRVAVRHRCRCPPDWATVCKSEQEQVLQLSKQGLLPQQQRDRKPAVGSSVQLLLQQLDHAMQRHDSAVRSWHSRKARAGSAEQEAPVDAYEKAMRRVVFDLLKPLMGGNFMDLKAVYEQLLPQPASSPLPHTLEGLGTLTKLVLQRRAWIEMFLMTLRPASFDDKLLGAMAT